jgi:hypothetical protein
MMDKGIFPKKLFLISGVLLIAWAIISGFLISDIEGGHGNTYQVGLQINMWSLLSFFFGLICLIYYFIL